MPHQSITGLGLQRETVVQLALQLNEVNLHNFRKWNVNLANQECGSQSIWVVLSSATENNSTPGSSESVLEVTANWIFSTLQLSDITFTDKILRQSFLMLDMCPAISEYLKKITF